MGKDIFQKLLFTFVIIMTFGDDCVLLSILSTVLFFTDLECITLHQTTNIFISNSNIDVSWKPQCLKWFSVENFALYLF